MLKLIVCADNLLFTWNLLMNLKFSSNISPKVRFRIFEFALCITYLGKTHKTVTVFIFNCIHGQLNFS